MKIRDDDAVLTPLKELLFPTHCFSCNAIGIEICSKCKRHWSPHFYSQRIDGLTVYSSIKYSPVARSILLSAKESSIRIADELLISALHNCLNRLPTNILRSAKLIAIPGSKKAIRKRGRDFILELAKELSRRTGIELVEGLSIRRRLLDQSGLSSADRKRNIDGAFEYEGVHVAGELILVDDLVTTGSTLLEARRALGMQNLKVNQAITACVAQTLNIGG